MSEGCDAYISVGSNLGDRLENCKSGIAGVAGIPGVRVTASSFFYVTEPVDYSDQEWFVNAVARVRTGISPEALLDRLQSIQKETGGTRDPIRFGPRILDLDILLYGDAVVESGELVIPHPRMHQRRFVLIPMCDIDPEVVHPVLKISMRRLLESLDDRLQRVIPYP